MRICVYLPTQWACSRSRHTRAKMMYTAIAILIREDSDVICSLFGESRRFVRVPQSARAEKKCVAVNNVRTHIANTINTVNICDVIRVDENRAERAGRENSSRETEDEIFWSLSQPRLSSRFLSRYRTSISPAFRYSSVRGNRKSSKLVQLFSSLCICDTI